MSQACRIFEIFWRVKRKFCFDVAMQGHSWSDRIWNSSEKIADFDIMSDWICIAEEMWVNNESFSCIPVFMLQVESAIFKLQSINQSIIYLAFRLFFTTIFWARSCSLICILLLLFEWFLLEQVIFTSIWRGSQYN